MHKVTKKFEIASQDSHPDRAGQTLCLTAAAPPGLQGGQRPGREGLRSQNEPALPAGNPAPQDVDVPALPSHRPPLPRGPCAAPAARGKTSANLRGARAEGQHVDLHAGPGCPRETRDPRDGGRPHARSLARGPGAPGSGRQGRAQPRTSDPPARLPVSWAHAPLLASGAGRRDGPGRWWGPDPAPRGLGTSGPGRCPSGDPARPLQAAGAVGVHARTRTRLLLVRRPHSSSWTKLCLGSSALI